MSNKKFASPIAVLKQIQASPLRDMQASEREAEIEFCHKQITIIRDEINNMPTGPIPRYVDKFGSVNTVVGYIFALFFPKVALPLYIGGLGVLGANKYFTRRNRLKIKSLLYLQRIYSRRMDAIIAFENKIRKR